MKRNLATRFIAEGSGDSDHHLHYSFHDQTNGDGCFYTDAGLSFQAVSNVNLQQTPFHAFHGTSDYPIGPTLLGLPFVPTSDPLAFQQMTPYSIQVDQRLKSLPLYPEKIITPKQEAVNEGDRFDFRSQLSCQPLMICNSSFRQLPVLPSPNQVTVHENQHDPNSFHLWPSSSLTSSWTVEAVMRNLNLPLLNTASFPALQQQKPQVMPPLMTQSMLARMRRKKISDKTRCLQKLLPWEKKMDMATMLEEVYKYIKFLQAQLSVLQSMPSESSFTSQTPANLGGCTGLERLNRQQLLQVLVNSPVVQTKLYSEGRCVVSLEQLLLVKQITDQTRVFQQQGLFFSR
ncbi:hypothetical protein NE237_032406 [Protea cynaroides]|uniref:BHLH domain-containing protein n=1 Tax=Protea cynaroides TaxID=273540 RepID=A0A9Q0R3D1_9MAGN|nr:hypothetical protein NE237_032406 [Protea cynaroides]